MGALYSTLPGTEARETRESWVGSSVPCQILHTKLQRKLEIYSILMLVDLYSKEQGVNHDLICGTLAVLRPMDIDLRQRRRGQLLG